MLHDGLFHVFLNTDVVQVMGECFEVANSQARRSGEFPEQKVLFRFQGANIGELEMRNDSPTHYREVRFNMLVQPALALLFAKIPLVGSLRTSNMVKVFGGAARRFGRW